MTNLIKKRLFSYAEIHLHKASNLLHEIKNDPSRLDIVLELQRFLIRRIVKTEARVLRLRRKRKHFASQVGQRMTPAKKEAKKFGLSAMHAREKQLLHLLFLWRCFGDGIAFLYQSKYSLKHTFYNSEYKPKESAGFMTEHGKLKKGFACEYRILIKGIKHKVPVVLCDLTNIICYGDVCAMGEDDPLCIEVKSSVIRDARAEKQLKQLDELANFYANDGAPFFRGNVNVQRRELHLPEVDHRVLLNSCIDAGLATGLSIVTPEKGLTYIVCSDPATLKPELLEVRKATTFYALTARPDYLPSFPFSLSMSPDNCVAFMQDRFTLLVLVDLQELKSEFAKHGVIATMLMNGVHAIQITKTPDNLMMGVFRISEQLLGRVATEFMSAQWFADEYSRIFDEHPSNLVKSDDVLNIPGVITSPLPGWDSVVDCWEKN